MRRVQRRWMQGWMQVLIEAQQWKVGEEMCHPPLSAQGWAVPIYSLNDLLANKINNQEKLLEYYLLLNSIFLLFNYKSFIT